MKRETNRHKYQKKIRAWAKENKELIFDTLGRKCAKCPEIDINNLEIHHKEYKEGIEYVEVLCYKCHDEFHAKELRLRLMSMMKSNAERSRDEFGAITIQDYIDGLNRQIKKMEKEGIYIIENLKIDGLPKEKIF